MSQTYDIQNTPKSVIKAMIALEVIYAIFFVIGILENVVVFHCIIKQKGRRQLTTNQLLMLHLALADMLILLTLTPAIFYSEYDITYSSFLACHVLHPMVTFYYYLRVYTQVTIAIERRRAIVTPLKPRFSKTAIVGALSLCWLLSAVFTVPVAWDPKLGPLKCEDNRPSLLRRKAYNTATFLLQFLVPLVIITTCYAKAGLVLRRSRFSSSRLGQSKSIQHEVNRQHNLRACKAFAIMVGVFALCTAPFNAICIWMEYGSARDAPFENQALYCALANLPVLLMSFLDPIIYGACCQSRARRCRREWCLITSWVKRAFNCINCS